MLRFEITVTDMGEAAGDDRAYQSDLSTQRAYQSDAVTARAYQSVPFGPASRAGDSPLCA